MKKLIALLLAVVMILAMAACAPAVDDGDDTTGGNAAGGEKTFAIVCKDASNPYMSRMVSGFKTACEDLGVKFIEKSPESATVDGQITIINELIAQGVNAIGIAANDAAALEATIKSARDKGIVVVTMDSDTKGSQMFINQAGTEQVAQVLVDSIYDMAGGEGKFAVLSASSTATNQNAWIAAMETIIKGDEKYAKLEWVETVYGDDESQKSTDETQNLLTKYPELEVICCPTTVGILACAQTVKNTEGCTVKVAGLGLPSEMKDYVGDDKVCPYMYLWNPIDVGSCAAYTIKAIMDEKVGEIGTKFTADNDTEYEVMAGDPADTQIIVGPPFAFNGENIGEWAEVY